MAYHLALALFAALYLNLFLCFGLGIRELAAKKPRTVFQAGYVWTIIALVTAVLWFFFEYVLSPLAWFPGYLFLYPSSLFACLGLEYLFFELFPSLGENPRIFRIGSAYNTFSLASLFLTIQFASGFGEALLFSLAFSAGSFGAYFTVREIRKRSFPEIVPKGVRGNPLLIISTGLLSLVVSVCALIIIGALVR